MCSGRPCPSGMGGRPSTDRASPAGQRKGRWGRKGKQRQAEGADSASCAHEEGTKAARIEAA